MGTATVAASPRTQGRTAAAKPEKSLPLRVFRTVHLWLGLSFGLLLVVQGLSGSALVWRPELDRLILGPLASVPEAPAGKAGQGPTGQGTAGRGTAGRGTAGQGTAGRGTAGPQRSLDAELAAVRQAAPAGKIRMVRMTVRPTGTDEWMVQMPPGAGGAATGEGPRWTVYVAPATGQVVGVRGGKRDALQWLIELHHTLLLGKTGRLIQGYLAIATMVLSLSGLWLWWPARWTPSRFKPRTAAKPLHYALGFWFMAPLLLISATATYFTWKQPMQRALGVAEPGRPEGGRQGGQRPEGAEREGAKGEGLRAEAPLRAPGVSLDAVLRAARLAQPEAALTALRLPEGKGPYTVQFQQAPEHFRAAPNSLSVRVGRDGATHVEKTTLWAEQPFPRRFLESLPRLHQGEYGGVVVRLIWCVTGFMPAVLYVSGFLMWRRRLNARR